MVTIVGRTLAFSASFPIEDTQSATFTIGKFPRLAFEIEVKKIPEAVSGMLLDTINPNPDGEITLYVPFQKEGKSFASRLHVVAMFDNTYLYAQIFARGYGELMQVDVSIFDRTDEKFGLEPQ